MTDQPARPSVDQIQDDVVPQQEQERAHREELQARAQGVLMAMADEGISDDPGVVREELVRRLQEADSGHHSDKWLDDTASELASGKQVIVAPSMGEQVRDKAEQAPEGGAPHGG